jgi:hypothetical protein
MANDSIGLSKADEWMNHHNNPSDAFSPFLTSFLSQLFPVLDPSTLIFNELEVH